MCLSVSATKWLLSFCVGVLVFMYIIVPKPFNFEFVLATFGLVIFNVIVYFLNWTKYYKNYLDFEPIFIVLSLIMGFTFPLLVYSFDEGAAYYFSFWKQYDLDNINKGAVMTGIALSAFLLGSVNMGFKKVAKARKIPTKINSTFILFLMLSFLFLFIITGGFQHYIDRYQNDLHESSKTSYFETIIVVSSQVLLFNEFWNKQNNQLYRINKVYLFLSLVVSSLFLFVGARTQGVFIALPIIIFLSKTYWPLSLKKFVIFMIFGILAMFFIQGFRANYQYDTETPFYYAVSDYLIPNTNTYLSCELVEKGGITYGKTMLSTILATIPFAQGFFEYITGLNQNQLQSGGVFTNYLGTIDGMGTNYVADSYLAFGLFGILIIPYLFGKLLLEAKNGHNEYYKYLMYYVLCSFAVYLVRSGMFFIFKYIFLAFVLSYINLSINTRKK